jgi:hypothetical protein
MDSVEPDLRKEAVNATPHRLLLPFTILDAMILVAGCAVSAWHLADQRVGNAYFGPLDPRYWLIMTWPIVLGPTIVAPAILKLQYIRGRLERLSVAEMAWLGLAVAWLPLAAIPFEWWHNHPALERLYAWYEWFLVYGLPPFSVMLLALALVLDWRRHRWRPWSHWFSLAIVAMHVVVVSGFIVFCVW